MKDRLEPCRQCEECPNCFARTKDGYCKILNNTEFFGDTCHFYKSNDEYKEELKKYPYIPRKF